MASLRKISGCAFAVAALTLVSSPGAHAATITVTTGLDHSAPASDCTLRDAITAANTNQPKDGCPTGDNNVDEIVLGARTMGRDGPATGDNDNTNGDLDIDTSMDLVGAGASRTTIDAQHIDRVIHVRVGGNVTLRGLTVTGGRSAVGGAGGDGGNGGGILNEGVLALEGTQVIGNVTGNGGGSSTGAGGNGGNGGGIYSSGSLDHVATSVIADNQTGDGGPGGAANAGGHGGDGGGIAATGFLDLESSTLSGNGTGNGGTGGSSGRGGDGGGLWAALGVDRMIQNSTIASNHAAGSGGGVASADGSLTLSYSTLTANTRGGANASSDVSAASGPATVGDSILGACAGAGVQDGGGDLGTNGTCPGAAGDPRLGPLWDNGGPTPTMALGAGSAAIDRIPATAGACVVAADQRGTPRPLGPGCDVGAFEAQPPLVTAAGNPGPDETEPRADQVAVVPATFAVGAESTALNGAASARSRRSVRRGTTISYRLSEPADALLSIEQRTSGLEFPRSKRAKARCLKATRANKRVLVKRFRRGLGRRAAGRAGRKRLARLVRRARCALYVPQVVLARTSRAGVNKVAFSGRIRSRALRRGRYRVVILATDAADNRSKPARASFRIVAAK